MNKVRLRAGSATLADWRAIYRGACPSVEESCIPAVEASAKAVAEIRSSGSGEVAEKHRSQPCRRNWRAIAPAHRSINDEPETCQPGARCVGREYADTFNAGLHADARVDAGHTQSGISRRER